MSERGDGVGEGAAVSEPAGPGGAPGETPAVTGGPVPGDATAGESGAGEPGAGEPGAGEPPAEGPRSGLRNPAAAVRGVGAGTLVLEAIVLLLAIVPLTKLGGHLTGAAIGAVLALVVLCGLLAGLMRYRWAWYGAMVVQVALFACGLFNVALAVLGVLFGAVWAYVLYVRHSITGRPAARRRP